MFCPRCSAQNNLEQKFCRNCGLSLPSVRLALEEKVDEAVAELRRTSSGLRACAWTLGFCIFSVPAMAFFGDVDLGLVLMRSSKYVGLWVVITLAIVVLVAIASYINYKQIDHVLNTLEGKEQEQDARPAIASTNELALQAKPIPQDELSLPAVPDTDPILAPPAPGSIAEHTTFELKKPEPR